MPRTSGIAIVFAALLALTGAALSQADLGARMNMDRLGDIQTGVYSAGDRVKFTLIHYAQNFLMRFEGEPEIYVLYPDHGSLGGRVLKFDSGGTALQVAGWGAMTIYTDAAPGGLPAERNGNGGQLTLPQVSIAAMQAAAEDESKHLSYARNLKVDFSADWSDFDEPNARAFAFDTMQNAARGIDRFTANPAGRQAFAQKVDTVWIEIGSRPTMALKGKTLIVTFAPSRGFTGRASSHGIARALGQLLSVPTPG